MKNNTKLAIRILGDVGWTVLLAAILSFVPCLAAAQMSYSVTDLGTLGGDNSIPSWINNNGVVVGKAETRDLDPITGFPVTHAFRWEKGVLQDLGTLKGNNSFASSVNNDGRVAGTSEIPTVDPNNPHFLEIHAFFWEEGVMRDLGTLGGNNSSGDGINDRHQVAGTSETTAIDPTSGFPAIHGYRLNLHTGTRIDLGTLGTGPNSVANSVNDLGQVVGTTQVNTSTDPIVGFPPFHSFLWKKGKMMELGDLGGIGSVANSINNRTQIVGRVALLDPNVGAVAHAFLWQKGVMSDLGVFPGDQDSEALGISDDGHIVGDSGVGFIETFSPGRALLWQEGSMTDLRMTDLNTKIPADSGFHLIAALSINSQGQIVASGVLSTGAVHAVLLTPRDEEDGDEEDVGNSAAQASPPDRAPSLSANARRLLQFSRHRMLKDRISGSR